MSSAWSLHQNAVYPAMPPFELTVTPVEKVDQLMHMRANTSYVCYIDSKHLHTLSL